MATIVVQRTGPGTWHYGLEHPDGITWTGTVTDLDDHGREASGPEHLRATVLLLVRLDPTAPTIRYDPQAVWEAAGRVVQAERRRLRRAPASAWQRATAGSAKGQGRSLSAMASSGRMGR